MTSIRDIFICLGIMILTFIILTEFGLFITYMCLRLSKFLRLFISIRANIKHNDSIGSSEFTEIKQLAIVVVVYVISNLLLALLLNISIYNLSFMQKKPVMHVSLMSSKPYKMTMIPFKIDGGQIIVTTQIGNENIKCLVDTGVGPIFWQSLNLRISSNLGVEQSYYPYTGVHLYEANRVVLKQISLGDYRMQNIDTLYFPNPHAPTLVQTANGHGYQMILGNKAFRDIVLTIDYAHNALILHSPEFDITKNRLLPTDILLNIDYDKESENYPDYPCRIFASGILEGRTVKFFLDTGYYSDEISINIGTRNKFDRVPPIIVLNNPINGISGVRMTSKTTTPLKWSIGTYKGYDIALMTEDSLIPEDQVILGWRQLKNFRITIDYKRKKLLLQPYEVNPDIMAPEISVDSVQFPTHQIIHDQTSKWPPISRAYHWLRHSDGSWEQVPNKQ